MGVITEVNPPFALQGGTIEHPALLFRQLLNVMSAEGVGRFNSAVDLRVTENSPAGMSVIVARGGAYVQGDDVTAQGLYFVYNDANLVLSINSADASLPRKDIVVAHVKDNTHGQAGDTWVLEVIAGTPAASPTEPTLPASALKLAVIDIPAADTTISNSQITDARSYAGAPVAWMKGGSHIGTQSQVNFGTSFSVTNDPSNKKVNVDFNPAVDKDAAWYRGVGTDYYYVAGFMGGALSTNAFATGTLFAVPFFSSRGGTVDMIGFNVTGTSAGAARVGIYTNTSDTNLYPDALVLDGGEKTVNTTGFKSSSISQALTANSLYWLVYLCGTAAPTITMVPLAVAIPILGFPSTSFASAGVGYSVSQSYGALPSSFPGSASVIDTTGVPMISVRYSA